MRVNDKGAEDSLLSYGGLTWRGGDGKRTGVVDAEGWGKGWNADVMQGETRLSYGEVEESETERARRRAPMVAAFEPSCEQDVQLLACSSFYREALYGDVGTDRELETLALARDIVECPVRDVSELAVVVAFLVGAGFHHVVSGLSVLYW